MASTALVPTNGGAAAQLALDLGATFTTTGLVFDPNREITIDEWQNIGRAVGFFGRAWRWSVADWLLYGETAFGEESAQGVDDKSSRYDIALRVLGLDQGTLMNMASIGRRIPPERRREELDFYVHAPVAPLEPDEQVEWLQAAIDNQWGKAELATAIRDSKQPNANASENGGGDDRLTLRERIELAARNVIVLAQPTGEGQYLVPAEPIAQLRSAFGEPEDEAPAPEPVVKPARSRGGGGKANGKTSTAKASAAKASADKTSAAKSSQAKPDPKPRSRARAAEPEKKSRSRRAAAAK